MVIGSWHGPRTADHSRYERRERTRERMFQNMMSAALKKKNAWELYGVLRQPSFRNHPYRIISCLCTTTLPYINIPEALRLRIVLIEICPQHHRYVYFKSA